MKENGEKSDFSYLQNKSFENQEKLLAFQENPMLRLQPLTFLCEYQSVKLSITITARPFRFSMCNCRCDQDGATYP